MATTLNLTPIPKQTPIVHPQFSKIFDHTLVGDEDDND